MSGTMRLHGITVDDDERDLSELDRGSTALLLSSCLDPAGREACRELLTAGPSARSNVVYVTFTRAGKHHLDWWTSSSDNSPDRIVIIDAAPVPSRKPPIEGGSIVYESIGSPGNLTKIGVAISKHCREWEGGTTVVCLRSLTALLQYVELDRAYRFLNATANHIACEGAIGHCHINPDAHPERELHALQTAFDATIDVDRGAEPGHR